MSFALRENKVAVTEEKCEEEHISLASLVKQVYHMYNPGQVYS